MYHSKGDTVWLDSPKSSIAYCVSTVRGSPGVAGMCVCTLEHVSWQGWRRGCLVRRTPSEPSPAWTLPCQPEQAGCKPNAPKTCICGGGDTKSKNCFPLMIFDNSRKYTGTTSTSHSKLDGYRVVLPHRPLCNILMIQIICKQIVVLGHPLYRRPGSEKDLKKTLKASPYSWQITMFEDNNQANNYYFYEHFMWRKWCCY